MRTVPVSAGEDEPDGERNLFLVPSPPAGRGLGEGWIWNTGRVWHFAGRNVIDFSMGGGLSCSPDTPIPLCCATGILPVR